MKPISKLDTTSAVFISGNLRSLNRIVSSTLLGTCFLASGLATLPLFVKQSIAQEAAVTADQGGSASVPQFTTDKDGKSQRGKEKKEDAKLKPGVVASYGKFDKRAAVDGSSSGNIAGEQQSPIAGSVKFIGGDRCEATITNLSEKDSYSVSFDVVGSRGSSRAFSKGYSTTVKPKANFVRQVSGCSSDLNVQVVLKSGRKLGQ